jgi:DNA-binding transcriptional regulator YbjK
MARPVRQSRGEERIEQTLRATLDVIRDQGLGAVTHRTVSDASGVPLGSLTYYFASKQELLRAALRLYVTEDVARLRATAEQLLAEGVTGEQVVARFAEFFEADPDGGLPQFELYLEASRDPELRAVAVECLQAYEEVAALGLRAAGIPEPEDAAAVVVAMVDGLGLQRIAAGPDAPAAGPALARLWRALARESA